MKASTLWWFFNGFATNLLITEGAFLVAYSWVVWANPWVFADPLSLVALLTVLPLAWILTSTSFGGPVSNGLLLAIALSLLTMAGIATYRVLAFDVLGISLESMGPNGAIWLILQMSAAMLFIGCLANAGILLADNGSIGVWAAGTLLLATTINEVGLVLYLTPVGGSIRKVAYLGMVAPGTVVMTAMLLLLVWGNLYQRQKAA